MTDTAILRHIEDLQHAVAERQRTIERRDAVITGLRQRLADLDGETAYLRQRVAELEAIDALLPPAGAGQPPHWQVNA